MHHRSGRVDRANSVSQGLTNRGLGCNGITLGGNCDLRLVFRVHTPRQVENLHRWALAVEEHGICCMQATLATATFDISVGIRNMG